MTDNVPSDPVVEWYKAGIDRSQLRENLRKTHEERLLALEHLQRFADEVRKAGQELRRGGK
jgi:hypothetical protein